MNKQALAFISMFTLVLMLSIYYVSLETIPPQSNTPVSDITSVMAVLNEQNQEKKDTLVLQLKEQLASSETSEEKKKEVLSKIETIENSKQTEEKIVAALEQKGFKSVVNIEDDIVKTSVFEVEKSNEKAAEIMRLIYPLISSNQTIELVFS
ncbi:hypothetical protein [Traorella massiliensis]|uniref:hypothetical protein n=2 Tax=Traorella massiliensis TaxID=1903263 RepID=UPI0008F88B82|nr:hypothetical protein [Traorella massiliensis]